jgi:2'-5' RNA ligase
MFGRMARLFTALALPGTVRAELAALANGLEGVRWVPPENLHLTMRYIGDVEPARQDAMAGALAQVRVEPFILPVAGLGVFPSRGLARVLWAGLGNAHTRLFQLRKQVDEALLSVDLTLDVHSFQPHITLGRLDENYDSRALTKFLARHADFEAPPFRVSEFYLMASETRPGRAPVYRTEWTFPLHVRP